VEVKYKNKLCKLGLTLSACLSGRYRCQGCLGCLKALLDRETYGALAGKKYDFIISCGASVAVVNFLMARENLAKSIALMRPSIFSTRKFDLVVMPRHDRPPRRKNVVITDGALNLINKEYMNDCISHIAERISSRKSDKRLAISDKQLYIGLLIGGDAKNFRLDKNLIAEVIKQAKAAAEELDADILATTSRRTSVEIENLIESEFKDYPRCKLLVIANKNNIAEAVGGILGLSNIVVVSPESISMVSEAAKSKKYVLAFNAPGLDVKHRRFLKYFQKNNYIRLIEADGLNKAIGDLWRDRPQIGFSDDDFKVKEAVKLLI